MHRGRGGIAYRLRVAADTPYAPPAIGPVSGADTVTLGGTAVFTASVTGFPTPTRQWRKDGLNLIDGGDITGARTGTLRIARLEAADAGSYSLFAANAMGSAVSDPVVAQFPITAPSVSTQPQSQTVSSGASATFTVAITGNPAPDYQWQRRPAGANAWENLAAGGGYAGVTSATLTVSATTAMSGDQFRCVSTNSAGAIASSGVALTVNASVVMEPAPSGGGGGGGVESPWLVAALFLLASARITTRSSMDKRALAL